MVNGWVNGQWLMDESIVNGWGNGQWSMVNCYMDESMVNGWVNGQWSMVNGWVNCQWMIDPPHLPNVRLSQAPISR